MTPQELSDWLRSYSRRHHYGTGLGMTIDKVADHALTPTSVIPHYYWQDLLQFTDIPREILREIARQRTG